MFVAGSADDEKDGHDLLLKAQGLSPRHTNQEERIELGSN
jgi:hypothetical protein